MRAVQLIGPENLVLRELPSRELVAHEVRVNVQATCVCGSDLKNYRNPVVVPQVPGHEFSGIIVEVGPGCDRRFVAGDRVTAFPMLGCMQCGACSAGNFRDCATKRSLGFQLPGSFAQEVIVDERFVVPLQSGLSYEQGALIEHLACGYRLAKEIIAAGCSPGATIVIIGDGPIALADVQALRVFGFTNVTVLGKHASRLSLARSLGTSRLLSTWEAGTTAVDVCVYAAPAEATLERVLNDVRAGGLVFPQTAIKSSSIRDAIARSRIALGRAFAYLLEDFSEVMKLVMTGVIQTDRLVTTRVHLREVPAEMIGFFDKSAHFKVCISEF